MSVGFIDLELTTAATCLMVCLYGCNYEWVGYVLAKKNINGPESFQFSMLYLSKEVDLQTCSYLLVDINSVALKIADEARWDKASRPDLALIIVSKFKI
jgi:hypothetical protein